MGAVFVDFKIKTGRRKVLGISNCGYSFKIRSYDGSKGKKCSTSQSGNHTQRYCILKNGIRMAKKSKWACARKRRT